MAEYIERSYIRKMAMLEMAYMMETETDAAVVLRMIEDAPAADVAPIRHGKIVETIENGRSKRVFTCCGEDFTQLTQWYMPDYCPNCGALMDGGKDDD